MVEVTFEYRDNLSGEDWKKQHCTVSSVEECKRIYGLGIDKTCEYRILEVKEVEKSVFTR